jgi:predicted metal-dependent hydrolase
VLDYVAAHEVTHLLEMNHGPRFWKLVARLVPRLEEAKAWLRKEGASLYRYGGKISASG